MVFKSDSGLDKAKKVVEGVLKSLGISPDDNVSGGVEGGCGWHVARGSADVLISLIPPQGGAAGRLRVVSPIVRLDGELPLGLTTRLLSLNGTDLPGVAFGIVSGNLVVLVAERSVTALDRSEVEEILHHIGFYADKYDDLLVNEFGGVRVCDIA